MKSCNTLIQSLVLTFLVLIFMMNKESTVLRSPALIFTAAAQSGPSIFDVFDNRNDYPGSVIPKYEKLEITFEMDTTAENPQFPYDPSPPSGIVPGIGVTVNALFTPDNWQTIYTQPAFLYQEFDDNDGQPKSGRDWFYPTDGFYWKVRFAPDVEGGWQYKLIAEDASGRSESPARQFTVAHSSNKGFIRVAQHDKRYFEFDDGAYFPGLGYNLNFDRVSWNNPIQENLQNFQIMNSHGIQLIRIWLTQWAFYGSAANPWRSMARGSEYDSLSMDVAYPGSDVSMKLDWQGDPADTSGNPAMFIGWMKQPPAVKRDTRYHISIRYLIPSALRGPRIGAGPYGLVAKTGGWIENPWDSGTGTVVTPYTTTSPVDQGGTPQWSMLEGELTSGNSDFLPYFYLVLENVIDGGSSGGSNTVYIDRVEIKEDLGGGQYGPNIVTKPWMAHHLYFEQRNSYAFDKVLQLAKEYDIYLRPVILEKNDYIPNRIDYNGSYTPDADNKWFYGNWRNMTKVRWLQRAWWRYLQARWGYSTNIHSWELLNEGDPFNGLHYTLADEFGKYMHQFGPNSHLVSTSFWHSFPLNYFWNNENYPNMDFADVHRYFEPNELYVRVDDTMVKVAEASDYYDTASLTEKLSALIGAGQQYGAGKPVIRGESGFGDDILADTQGIWLHNFIWGGINPGGMIDSGDWYPYKYIYNRNSDGSYAFDRRKEYGNYFRFIKDIPLNNGYYQDAQAICSNPNLRAWGQKDLANNKAHLWIQNRHHTWKNVVDSVSIEPVSGAVTIQGFEADQAYALERWDTYSGALIGPSLILTSTSSGDIILPIHHLEEDFAVRIEPAPGKESPQSYLPVITKGA